MIFPAAVVIISGICSYSVYVQKKQDEQEKYCRSSGWKDVLVDKTQKHLTEDSLIIAPSFAKEINDLITSLNSKEWHSDNLMLQIEKNRELYAGNQKLAEKLYLLRSRIQK